MVKHKESESGSESVEEVEESHFRIAICMKRFFSDHRARALLYVSARRRVRWLQRRLRRLFALPPALLLLRRGHLLPPGEPLALLDRDDLVEVVPAADTADPAPPAADTADPAPPAADTADPVPPAADTAPPAATVAEERALSPGRPDALSESKRRALLVLDQCCGPAEAPRRRRVRRRRRPPAATEREEPSPSPESTSAVFRAPEPDTAAAVRRNELRPRAPRLVRDVLACDVVLSDESLSAVEHSVEPFAKILTLNQIT